MPPQANADFVYHREAVVAVDTRPYDPRYPLVGMAELSKQLVGEARPPLPAEPGQPRR